MSALHVFGYSLGGFATARACYASAMRDGVTELATGATATDAWRALWARLDPDAEDIEADPAIVIG